MKNAWNIGRLTIVIGIVMLAGNLAMNTAMIVDRFTNDHTPEHIVQVAFEPPAEIFIEDPEFLHSLGVILRTTPSGNEALTVASDHGIEVAFRNTGGSSYQLAHGYIVLDRTISPLEASLDFVHEMAHALNHMQGYTGDIFISSRDEFIMDMLWDEAMATAKTIYAKVELEDTNAELPDIPGALEESYWKAYRDAVIDARAPNAWDWESAPKTKITKAEADMIGREAGLERMVTAFENGEVIGSVTGETYPTYYGRMWDLVN